MHYLNHKLLTSDKIVDYLQSNISHFSKAQIDGSKTPNNLSQFQKDLRCTFFDKSLSSNQSVLRTLDMDERFQYYPKLKAILHILLGLNDPTEITEAIDNISKINVSDWDFKPSKFDEYNQRLGYFSNPSAEIRSLFKELTLACHRQLVFFEHERDNPEAMAYDAAYKLMAIFMVRNVALTPNRINRLYSSIHRLLNSAENDQSRPLHEAFTVKLKDLPHASMVHDREGWRSFIVREKIKSLPFFKEEQTQGKAPKNFHEANQWLIKSFYTNANQDMSFATLCYKYKVQEFRFNRCLNFIKTGWPKKRVDDIPDLQIIGKGDAEGLFWVKLNPNDKRGLILGDITDCCQSIGGESEQCVKDAVSLDFNGLYVLLKQKKNVGAPIFIQSEINENDYKIIGQSYVWKSFTGNLCLDSFECLKGEISAAALKALLLDFSENVFQTNPSIRYVTIGRGGKTPDGLFETADIPEMMLKGEHYGDSIQQTCIARKNHEHHLDQEPLRKIFAKTSSYGRDYLCAYTVPGQDSLFAQLQELLITGPHALEYVAKIQDCPYEDELIIGLIFLSQKNLLTEQAFLRLVEHESIYELLTAFKSLQHSNLLTPENAKRIENHQNPETIANTMNLLNIANILDERNLEMLTSHHNPYALYEALKSLYQAKLLTQENFDSVARHPKPMQMVGILKSLDSIIMNLARVNLLNEKNRSMLVAHPNLKILDQVFQRLLKQKMLTQEYFEILTTHHHIDDLFQAIEHLCDLDMLIPANLSIVARLEKPTEMTSIFGILKKDIAQLGIVTHPEMKELVSLLWQSLLLSHENCQLLKEHPNPGILLAQVKNLEIINQMELNNLLLIKSGGSKPSFFENQLAENSVNGVSKSKPSRKS